MVAAVEHAKFSYVLNRDAQDKLVNSFPLEAEKSSCNIFDLQSLDIGNKNPAFDSLQHSYDDNSESFSSTTSCSLL